MKHKSKYIPFILSLLTLFVSPTFSEKPIGERMNMKLHTPSEKLANIIKHSPSKVIPTRVGTSEDFLNYSYEKQINLGNRGIYTLTYNDRGWASKEGMFEESDISDGIVGSPDNLKIFLSNSLEGIKYFFTDEDLNGRPDRYYIKDELNGFDNHNRHRELVNEYYRKEISNLIKMINESN